MGNAHLCRVMALLGRGEKYQGQRSVDLVHRLGYCHGNLRERLCTFELGSCAGQAEESHKDFAARWQ